MSDELVDRLQQIAKLSRELETELAQLRLEIDLGYFRVDTATPRRTAKQQQRLYRKRYRRGRVSAHR